MVVIFDEPAPLLPQPHEKTIAPSTIWAQYRLSRIIRHLELILKLMDNILDVYKLLILIKSVTVAEIAPVENSSSPLSGSKADGVKL